MVRNIFQLILLASLITNVSPCGKKRCHKLTGKNCANNKNTPAPQQRQDVVKRMVGKDIVTDEYSSAGEGPVTNCNDLNCDFDGGCCWQNNQPPNDQLHWARASGQPESQKMQRNFGTTNVPQGDFLITASETAGTSSQTAQFYSCAVTCISGDVTVRLKHWQSSGTHLEVCSFEDPNSSPSNCRSLPTTSGQESSVTVPGGQNTRVVILAKGFTAPGGTVAMIDDIKIDCQTCPETTTTSPPTEPTPSPSPTPLPPCREINCNFEQGNPCAYSTTSSSGTANMNWAVHEAPWENPLTGIKKTGEGRRFASSYLKKAGEKSVLASDANFDNPYVVRFDYYKAVEGVELRACCDTDTSCPFTTTTDVQVSHYKGWRRASIQCPAGTKRVLFVSENQRGANEGACAVDDIQLLQSAGDSPDSASQPACLS